MKIFKLIGVAIAFAATGSFAYNHEQSKSANRAIVKYAAINKDFSVNVGVEALAARGTYVECPKQATVTVTETVCTRDVPAPSAPAEVTITLEPVPSPSAPTLTLESTTDVPPVSAPGSSVLLSTTPTPAIGTSISTAHSLTTAITKIVTDDKPPPPTTPFGTPTPPPAPSNLAVGHQDVRFGILLGGMAFALAV
ncbi:hypothetical protein P154DRAFT_597770 [Amniculicola lignicola CBS 123094]|uniref:Uncharacterized protein n=1 Tax=Amniculicola lignicola CBS 123094 TaxID=1392246 RepID=A0A6A5WI08_9PLEO|nr:hypothetical protein P154DRAFT_597770 [Amniculicola lignicola CBS 123094]